MVSCSPTSGSHPNIECSKYNTVVDYLKEYIDSASDETVLLGTADHECGGLTLGGIVSTGEYQ
jgi:alkaline phosphatase